MATSHTELSCFRRCQREHHYRYVLYMDTLVKAKPLQVGERVDNALGKTLKGEVPDFSLLEPAERAMVAVHSVRWKGQLRVEQVQVPFKVRIGSVEVGGKLDAVGVQVSTGRRMIVECKTTSEDIGPGSGYWRRVSQIDPQATIYLYAAKTLGLEPFLLWDALRKPAHRQKTNETNDAFSERVATEMATTPEYYFQRKEIVRHDEEHKASMRDLEGTIHLMQVTRMQLQEAPRNVDACFKWGRECDFFKVCGGETTIDDTRYYKKRERPGKASMTTKEEIKYEF